MLQAWGGFIHALCYGEMLMCWLHARGEATLDVLQKLAHLSPSRHSVLRERGVMLPLPCKGLAHITCAAHGKLLMHSRDVEIFPATRIPPAFLPL